MNGPTVVTVALPPAADRWLKPVHAEGPVRRQIAAAGRRLGAEDLASHEQVIAVMIFMYTYIYIHISNILWLIMIP